MRNPDRLDLFYDELKKIHKEKVPDWRFTQLIHNVFFGIDPYYMEEDKAIEHIKKYFVEDSDEKNKAD